MLKIFISSRNIAKSGVSKILELFSRKSKSPDFDSKIWSTPDLQISNAKKNERNSGVGQSGMIIYNFQVIFVFEVVLNFEVVLILRGCLRFWGHLYFWGRPHFWGHLHFLGHLLFCGCLLFWGCLHFWFDLVFFCDISSFKVAFILRVFLIF